MLNNLDDIKLDKPIGELIEEIKSLGIDKATELYNSLIDIKKVTDNSIYSECHHILPKCLGGSNFKENLVNFTVENHIIAHLILIGIYPNEAKLLYALHSVTLYSKKSNKDRINYILSLDIETISKIRTAAANARIGKKLSDETKLKISESHKGEKNPNFGKPRSEETKKKISESHKRENLSVETRKRLSLSKSGKNHPMFGKKVSEETRKKMSLAHKGEKNHFFNKHHTDEVRSKLSTINKGKTMSDETRSKISMSGSGKVVPISVREKISKSRKGIIFSEETRKRMSEAKKHKKVVVDSYGNNLGNLKNAAKLLKISVPTLKKWIDRSDKGLKLISI